MNATHTAPFDHETTALPENRSFRPKLLFYHANAKGTGSAVQFELHAAQGDQEGKIFVSLAAQRDIAEPGQNASFDWKNKVTVKLNFNDLCAILLVLDNRVTELGEGKGLYHDSKSSTTIIRFARQTEHYSGYAFDVSRKNKLNEETPNRVRILFNDAEAYGLKCAIEQSMAAVAFGTWGR